jgi:hypothetical protein
MIFSGDAMTDQGPASLTPGNPVLWCATDGPEGLVTATVLRQLGPTRYLIQMDPPTLPKAVIADALERDMILAGVDPSSAARAREIFRDLDLQEPIEVDRTELVVLADWSE